MLDSKKKLEVLFFRTDHSNEPVREWLLSLAKDERKIIGEDVLKFNIAGLLVSRWWQI
jgi:hypothetical protein